MDSSFFLDDVTIVVDFSVLSHTGAWWLLHMLSLLFLVHFVSNDLTKISGHNWLFFFAPQAALFPQRTFCHLLIQFFIFGLVLHMHFQIFYFNVVFNYSSLPLFLFGLFTHSLKWSTKSSTSIKSFTLFCFCLSWKIPSPFKYLKFLTLSSAKVSVSKTLWKSSS